MADQPPDIAIECMSNLDSDPGKDSIAGSGSLCALVCCLQETEAISAHEGGERRELEHCLERPGFSRRGSGDPRGRDADAYAQHGAVLRYHSDAKASAAESRPFAVQHGPVEVPGGIVTCCAVQRGSD